MKTIVLLAVALLAVCLTFNVEYALVKDQPRLRGTMLSTQVTAADLKLLGQQWKANHVRWPLLWDSVSYSPADNADLKAYDAWLEKAIARLDQLLPVCEQVGLKVLIDLHTPPGGRDHKTLYYRMFEEKRFQDAFLQLWKKIAHHYQGNMTIWGYDLLNEPAEGYVASPLLDWQPLALQAAQNIRKIDQQHAIIVESYWGDPAQLSKFAPLSVPGMVYSVHMYNPMHFTHQGIYGNPTGVSYPGKIDGKYWDKQQLRQVLQPVVDYQKKYGVPIYIGEFSAVRWSPDNGSYKYLRDVIDIFEENSWSWAYHAFREWNGWSVEHGSNRNDQLPSNMPTDREKLLRAWFAKN